jgi:hypothetical protein
MLYKICHFFQQKSKKFGMVYFFLQNSQIGVELLILIIFFPDKLRRLCPHHQNINSYSSTIESKRHVILSFAT